MYMYYYYYRMLIAVHLQTMENKNNYTFMYKAHVHDLIRSIVVLYRIIRAIYLLPNSIGIHFIILYF